LHQLFAKKRDRLAASLFLFIAHFVLFKLMEDRLSSHIQELFLQEGYTDCYLVELVITGKKIEVFVDADSSMDFAKCQRISRFLEAKLDETGWYGDDYILEVSSPGITRPLKFSRQYKKNIGRIIKVKMIEKDEIQGKIIESNEDSVTIEFEVKYKVGKKNVKETKQEIIPFSNVEKAVIQISFNQS
jgi:ribosome maturation factor RimP